MKLNSGNNGDKKMLWYFILFLLSNKYFYDKNKPKNRKTPWQEWR